MTLYPSEQPVAESVSPEVIRHEFNHGQYWERVQNGELTPNVMRDTHPVTPPEGGPICTRKQMVVYYTPDGEPVAWVHQFLRPDGTLGASGKPDPKRLVIGQRILFVRTQQ